LLLELTRGLSKEADALNLDVGVDEGIEAEKRHSGEQAVVDDEGGVEGDASAVDDLGEVTDDGLSLQLDGPLVAPGEAVGSVGGSGGVAARGGRVELLAARGSIVLLHVVNLVLADEDIDVGLDVGIDEAEEGELGIDVNVGIKQRRALADSDVGVDIGLDVEKVQDLDAEIDIDIDIDEGLDLGEEVGLDLDIGINAELDESGNIDLEVGEDGRVKLDKSLDDGGKVEVEIEINQRKEVELDEGEQVNLDVLLAAPLWGLVVALVDVVVLVLGSSGSDDDVVGVGAVAGGGVRLGDEDVNGRADLGVDDEREVEKAAAVGADGDSDGRDGSHCISWLGVGKRKS
jgi:hypothetical protein